MTNDYSKDLRVAIRALEYFITTEEQFLIDTNAGDMNWNELNSYKTTLNRFKLMETIYGN